jgi:uncharacterized damage-inducible protein DinB
MALAQLLLPEFDAEMASTRRLLECVPDGKASWQPHQRSMTLGRLATHVADLAGRAAAVMGQDEWDPRPPGSNVQPQVLETRKQLLERFEEGSRKAREALAATGDAAFSGGWAMKREGKPVWSGPRLDAYRRIAMNHLVHHRAQLGVYLRLLGVEIPGMYGPSADDLAKLQAK